MTADKFAQTVLVTGGAGFIGSHLVEQLIDVGCHVVNLDALTYAGNLENIERVAKHERYTFVHGDIGNQALVSSLLADHKPSAILNLAAESHVDRSIDNAVDFIDTNIAGVYRILHVALAYWRSLSGQKKDSFRFVQMSTDEVYGSITQGSFTEQSAYSPNSPYAASKAAADHLVRAFHVTYGLPTLTARASNTYGPRQFPEKLIPHIINSILSGQSLPVYGQGQNVRDWMFVGDLVRGLASLLESGVAGETYNFAAGNEATNIDIVRRICAYLDVRIPARHSYETAIKFVTDRPGHDLRYAMASQKVRQLIHWTPDMQFDRGLALTIDWYLANQEWLQRVLERGYTLRRLGLENA